MRPTLVALAALALLAPAGARSIDLADTRPAFPLRARPKP
jgi:hypothetical protein